MCAARLVDEYPSYQDEEACGKVSMNHAPLQFAVPLDLTAP